MMGTELCSSRVLSPFREESGDEELSVLPRHTKVVVTGNNRTKSVLLGLQGVVKKAVGLGGWHWLVLKNGVEVKLQRNALSVLEAPTGDEDDDYDFDDSSSGSEVGEKDNHHFPTGVEYRKVSKPRVRYTRPWATKSNSRSSSKDVETKYCHLYQQRVNFAKLGTSSLWRYWRSHNLESISTPNPTKDQLVNAVQRHFAAQRVDEVQVVVEFIRAAKRLRSADLHRD
nr:Histone deacetylase complex subunit SAP30/SAP30-like [Ipomoea batatas]